MKQPLLLMVVFFVLTGCKKTIQKQEENAIIQAMTDGQWVITTFTVNDTDITSDFTSYRFQYFSNYTVQAIRNGAVEKTGDWQGDINAMTIWASFPNATDPLLRLNGTWQITDNSWTYVKATMNSGSEIRTLRLDKQ